MYAASVSMGEIFLPTINRTIKRFMPFIEKFREWAKTHKEVIKSVARMGLYLLGTATAVGVVTRAFRIFNSVMKMSTLGKLITLMVIGGGLIVDNWDTIGPIVKEVWRNIDGVAQALGGWENILKGILAFVATKWAVDMVTSIRSVTEEIGNLSKASSKMGKIGGMAKKTGGLSKAAKGAGLLKFLKIPGAIGTAISVGTMLYEPISEMMEKNNDYQKNEPLPSIEQKPLSPQDLKSIGLLGSPFYRDQQGGLHMTVDFRNLPTGAQVKTEGSQPPWLDVNVGYSRFARQ